MAMATYRIYQLNAAEQIDGPPDHIDCSNDSEAIEQGKVYLDGHAIEIWQSARLVKRLYPPGTST